MRVPCSLDEVPTAGVGPNEKVQGLGSRMRCRECDEKGRAVISITLGYWGAMKPRPDVGHSGPGGRFRGSIKVIG